MYSFHALNVRIIYLLLKKSLKYLIFFSRLYLFDFQQFVTGRAVKL